MHHQLQDTIITPRQSDTIINSGPQQSVKPATDSGMQALPVTTITREHPVHTQSIILSEKPVIELQKSPPTLKTHGEIWNSNGNFLKNNGLKGIVRGLSDQKTASSFSSGTLKPDAIMIRARNLDTYDWMLGVFMLLVVLFVWIRIFYSKFFGMLANALVSFHLSVKLFQEKNVLLRRVSTVLDFIYLTVFSIFIFQIVEYYHISSKGMNGFKLFLLLLNLVILYAMVRILVLRATGTLFMARTLFSEYLHNTFVINKGMGIVLFPVVVMAEYMPHQLIPVVLTAGLVSFAFSVLFKAIRAYQIIIRRDILLFYLILYLCTLEILPLLLGYKFVTSLIQSN